MKEQIFNQYLITALWSETDLEGNSLDSKFNVLDIPEKFKEQALSDVSKFLDLAFDLFTPEEWTDTIGHDFWLTRNDHGAGFWDGDYVEGQALSDIVKKYFSENSDELRSALE